MTDASKNLTKQELALVLRFISDCRLADTEESVGDLAGRLSEMISFDKVRFGFCGIDGTWKKTFNHSASGSLATEGRDGTVDLHCEVQRSTSVKSVDGGLVSCQKSREGSDSSCLYIEQAVDSSLKTEKFILDNIVPHLLEAWERSVSLGDGDALPEFTVREREVLSWLKEGKSNWDIAQILGISERTVKFHILNIFNKLGVNTRAKAAALAAKFPL